jgi:predicted PurR-regulated permease PerM
MNGLLVLVSLLGGLAAFGLIGIVIGPVVVATMTSLLAAYTGPRQHGRRGHTGVAPEGVASSSAFRS